MSTNSFVPRRIGSSFLGINRPEHGADHLPSCNAEVKNDLSPVLHVLVYLWRIVLGTTLSPNKAIQMEIPVVLIQASVLTIHYTVETFESNYVFPQQ
jgi:hypothetical protein